MNEMQAGPSRTLCSCSYVLESRQEHPVSRHSNFAPRGSPGLRSCEPLDTNFSLPDLHIPLFGVHLKAIC